MRKGGRRGEGRRRRREEIPEENGGSCADDAATVRSDQKSRYFFRMTNKHLHTSQNKLKLKLSTSLTVLPDENVLMYDALEN